MALSPDRDQIVKILDPRAFDMIYATMPVDRRIARRIAAYAKADAILALLNSPPEDERSKLSGGWEKRKTLDQIGDRIADEVEKAASGRQSNCEQAAADILAIMAVQWRPIESAPIRKPILVGNANWDGVMPVHWVSEDRKGEELRDWINGPTHWMHQPALPQDHAPVRGEDHG